MRLRNICTAASAHCALRYVKTLKLNHLIFTVFKRNGKSNAYQLQTLLESCLFIWNEQEPASIRTSVEEIIRYITFRQGMKIWLNLKVKFLCKKEQTICKTKVNLSDNRKPTEQISDIKDNQTVIQELFSVQHFSVCSEKLHFPSSYFPQRTALIPDMPFESRS